MNFDHLIVSLDRALRTVFAPAQSARPVPGVDMEETGLSDSQRRFCASLMRVNHTGEVCAQALYEGQLLVARDEPVRKLLTEAAREETEHLAWTERRLSELGGRKSLLDPSSTLAPLLSGQPQGCWGIAGAWGSWPRRSSRWSSISTGTSRDCRRRIAGAGPSYRR